MRNQKELKRELFEIKEMIHELKNNDIFDNKDDLLSFHSRYLSFNTDIKIYIDRELSIDNYDNIDELKDEIYNILNCKIQKKLEIIFSSFQKDGLLKKYISNLIYMDNNFLNFIIDFHDERIINSDNLIYSRMNEYFDSQYLNGLNDRFIFQIERFIENNYSS